MGTVSLMVHRLAVAQVWAAAALGRMCCLPAGRPPLPTLTWFQSCPVLSRDFSMLRAASWDAAAAPVSCKAACQQEVEISEPIDSSQAPAKPPLAGMHLLH